MDAEVAGAGTLMRKADHEVVQDEGHGAAEVAGDGHAEEVEGVDVVAQDGTPIRDSHAGPCKAEAGQYASAVEKFHCSPANPSENGIALPLIKLSMNAVSTP